MTIDLASDGDRLCDATTVMFFGLDLERRTVVCIMPDGHDTPHMPEDPQTVDNVGRLIVRRMTRGH